MTTRTYCACGKFDDTDHACPVTYAKLKQESDELAAQVEMMRDALVEAARNENYPPFAKSKFQSALSITKSEALREVRARTQM